MSLAAGTAAADWVHAFLMGIDPSRIALVREAFTDSAWPLSTCRPEQIVVNLDGEEAGALQLPEIVGRPLRLPSGWIGHCELNLEER
jgi:hypothetical protein